MEEDLNRILENFLNSSQELINSQFIEELKAIRIEYLQEVGRPGCTPCIVNAAKRKYSERVKSIMSQKKESDDQKKNDDKIFDPLNNDTIASP